MKVLRIDLDESEMPETADVRLTLVEMHLLYNLTGRTAPWAVAEAAGGEQMYGEANDVIAETLSGSIFNRFWDGGADDVGPKFGVVEIAARMEAERG